MESFNSSSLHIELLFIGVQFVLVLGVLFGLDLIVLIHSAIEAHPTLEAVAVPDWAIVPISIVFVAICYSLGSAIDALAAFVKTGLECTKWFPVPSNREIMSFRKQSPESEELYRSIFRSDFEQRLLRATGLNACLLGGASLYNAWYMPGLVIMGVGLLTLGSWGRRLYREVHRLRAAVPVER